MKRLLIFILWPPVTLATLIVSLFFLNSRSHILANKASAKENEFSEQILENPEQTFFLENKVIPVLGISSGSAQLKSESEQEDPVYHVVYQYLAKYHSPMLGESDVLVKSALEYNVDPLLIVAIAQCETNLGRKSPENCYNPFGLGIYSQKKLCFSNWSESFELMAKILRNKYHDQGLNTPEEIMAKYCPDSALEKDGQWAKCVNRFKTELENNLNLNEINNL